MRNILIIDDEENFGKLVKKNIEKTGEFTVRVATNGLNGIKFAREIKPDLILLDIAMPDLDGGDVLTLIRRDPSIADTPIIFLTALVKQEEMEEQPSFTKGYTLLAKTVSVDDLLSCIREHMKEYP